MILLTHMVHDFYQLMDCIGAANSSYTSSYYPYADSRGGHEVCLPTENIGIVVLLQSGRTSPWYQVCLAALLRLLLYYDIYHRVFAQVE